MSETRNFFVVVCNDHNMLIEADEIEEVLEIVNSEFKDVNLDFDKFTVLPVTDVFMITEEEDDDEKLPEKKE
jgi:hypothetical protein